MQYENITLEKGMYNNPNKSFTQILEELDPSENYIGSPLEHLDAFQRQLKRFNIRATGFNCDCVSKFYESTQSAALVPEFLTRAVKNGINNNNVNILNKIIASKTKINTLTYHNIVIDSNEEKNKAMEPIQELNSIPETQIKMNDETIKLVKKGRMLTASYETIEHQPLSSWTIALNQIGQCLNNSTIKDAVDTLVKGDNKANAAEVIKLEKNGELSYADLIKAWSYFEDYKMNTIIAHPASLAKLVCIPELQNPLSGINFQSTGTVVTPFGAQIVRTNAAPKDAIILLDNDYALLQLIFKDITVESDKIIDKQLTRTAIYFIGGFSKPFKKASVVLSLK